MLNELYVLSNALANINLKLYSWHREYKELPKVSAKAPCYRIWLSPDGSVASIDVLDADAAKLMRKYGNNQRSFPAFNIKPLYRITGGQRQYNWLKSLKKIDNSLGEISHALLDAIKSAGATEELSVVIKLIEATQTLTEHGLRNALKQYITPAIERGDERLRPMLEYSGKENKAPEEDMGDNISVIFDYDDWSNYGRQPVAHEDTTRLINDALNRADTKTPTISPNGQALDAFGSAFDSGAESEPMPEVKLPGYSSALRTMFKGQPCHNRYGKFGDASYPIANENRVATKTAQEFLARPENEYKTWAKAKAKADMPEIVFVYPEKLEGLDNKYAAILAPQKAEGEQEEIAFKAVADDFSRVFKALSPKKQPEYLQIFSLQRVEKYSNRSKLVLTRSLSPQDYINCAEQWEIGCRNIPIIADVTARTPFPIEIASIFNTVWKRNGDKHKKPSTRIKHYQGIELLINNTEEHTLMSYLHLLVQNTAGLVAFSSKPRFSWEHPANKLSLDHAKILAGITSVFGLMLHKYKIPKERYMIDAAFMTGRLLKICDDLHALYCQVERKGETPPQFAGASMFNTASDSPVLAMALIQKRMIPYLAWAKTYRHKQRLDEKSLVRQRTATSRLRLLEELSEPLSKALVAHTRFSDLEKAQLFLGYLAALPKREKYSEGDTQDEQQSEQ